MNSLFVIKPYKIGDTWVFDDPPRGLLREPFVAGADDIIERAAIALLNRTTDVTIVFGIAPFPGYQIQLDWVRFEMGGDTYRVVHGSPRVLSLAGMEGWLCPALRKYFPEAPKSIYAQFK